jgi:hypothetical protein
MINKNQQEINILPEVDYLVTYEQLNALITFQKLWSQLSMWLRSLLISTVENLDNKEAVTYQLYKIPTDFYNTFRVFYGPLISQQFLNLLNSLITSTRTLIESLQSGNDESVNSAVSQMYSTADELAAFLARINVYWDEAQWKNLLHQFVRLLIDEIIAMISGNYEQEILIFNRMDDLTDIMGSYMARGIISRNMNPVSSTL